MAGARGWQANRGCRLVVLKWVYWSSLRHLPLLAANSLWPSTAHNCMYITSLLTHVAILDELPDWFNRWKYCSPPNYQELHAHWHSIASQKTWRLCWWVSVKPTVLLHHHIVAVACIYCWVAVWCRYKWLQVLDCRLYGDLKRCSLLTLLVW